MNCTSCGSSLAMGARFCGTCGTSAATPAATLEAPGSTGTRDRGSSAAALVYPRNPPLSPHLALLGLMIVGLPQLVFGQVGKGIVLFCLFWVSFVAVVVPLLVLAAAIVDAYMVGFTLQKGQPVGRWQFFPSP